MKLVLKTNQGSLSSHTQEVWELLQLPPATQTLQCQGSPKAPQWCRTLPQPHMMIPWGPYDARTQNQVGCIPLYYLPVHTLITLMVKERVGQ